MIEIYMFGIAFVSMHQGCSRQCCMIRSFAAIVNLPALFNVGVYWYCLHQCSYSTLSQVTIEIGVLMYRCQHNQAPRYLTDHCTPVSDTVFRQRLRSASSHQVSVPRYRLSTCGRRAFSVAGPTVWNSLPEDMRDPKCSVDSYRQSLKTFLFSQY